MRIASGLLSMTGAQLTQAGQDGNALDADWLKVGGSVLLNSAPDQGTRFTAAGAVSLPGAQVGGSLYLTGADLKAEVGKTALNAEGIQIARKLAWGTGETSTRAGQSRRSLGSRTGGRLDRRQVQVERLLAARPSARRLHLHDDQGGQQAWRGQTTGLDPGQQQGKDRAPGPRHGRPTRCQHLLG
jgi:hypothetical protein